MERKMTKTSKVLEDVFDLPLNPSNDVPDTIVERSAAMTEILPEALLDKLDKIDMALPMVSGFEKTEAEFDELALLAIGAFKDLNDMVYNVDSKHAGEISSSAASYLGHAITARKNKVEQKLKMIELQLKKLKLDQDKSKNKNPDNNPNTEPITGDAVLIDRNQLLERILGENKKAL